MSVRTYLSKACEVRLIRLENDPSIDPQLYLSSLSSSNIFPAQRTNHQIISKQDAKIPLYKKPKFKVLYKSKTSSSLAFSNKAKRKAPSFSKQTSNCCCEVVVFPKTNAPPVAQNGLANTIHIPLGVACTTNTHSFQKTNDLKRKIAASSPKVSAVKRLATSSLSKSLENSEYSERLISSCQTFKRLPLACPSRPQPLAKPVPPPETLECIVYPVPGKSSVTKSGLARTISVSCSKPSDASHYCCDLCSDQHCCLKDLVEHKRVMHKMKNVCDDKCALGLETDLTSHTCLDSTSRKFVRQSISSSAGPPLVYMCEGCLESFASNEVLNDHVCISFNSLASNDILPEAERIAKLYSEVVCSLI